MGEGMFAKQLKETLETVNKTKLAEAVGCSRDSIVKWQAGVRYPSVKNLIRICIYLYPDEWEKAYLHFSVLIEQDD
jgi:transcriptional regulator with XRE-family HTH domain